MKRSWFGGALLAAVLILSLLGDWASGRCHRPISQGLEDTCRNILETNWPQATRLAEEAQNRWDHCRPFRSAIGNQSATEEVDYLLSRLKILLDTRDPEAAALCAEISRRVEESKYLLAETDLPMSQISQLLGFSSLSYFSQVFRRSQNTSPMEYRKATHRL